MSSPPKFGARITVPGTVQRLGIDAGVRVIPLADGTKISLMNIDLLVRTAAPPAALPPACA